MPVATAKRRTPLGDEVRKGGGRNLCSICNHPDRAEIDQNLAALMPMRRISKRYGLSMAAIGNHRDKHGTAKEVVNIKRMRGQLGNNKNPSKTALERIEDGLTALEDLMQSTNDSLYISAYKERLRTLEIIGKAKGEFSDAPSVTINLWQTPIWQQLRLVIFEELANHPEIRAALAKRLISLEESQLPQLPEKT